MTNKLAKEYNSLDLKLIREKIGGTLSGTESEQQENTTEQENLTIQILREELNDSKKQLERAFEEKKDLVKLIDQQQQLQLNTQKQLEQFKIENREEKHKWYHIFKSEK